jgi:hypothetical protein
MQRLNMLCLATAVCILAGCNQPSVTLKPPASQSSENTVRDWNDVAHKISAGMALRGLLPVYSPSGEPVSPTPKPIMVRVQAPDSTFIREVAGELESDILQQGGIVARTPDGATVVNLDVNFVKWGPRDKPPGLTGGMAALVALPAIVIGASLPMATWVAADAAAATVIGGAVVADGITAITPSMNAEAVWEATIVTDNRVVMKLQEPIYIREADISLYAKSTSLSPAFSWSSSPPLRARMIRYDQM